MGIFRFIKEEIDNIAIKDPAVNSKLEILMYPSFKAIIYYRISHKLYLKEHYTLARWLC